MLSVPNLLYVFDNHSISVSSSCISLMGLNILRILLLCSGYFRLNINSANFRLLVFALPTSTIFPGPSMLLDLLVISKIQISRGYLLQSTTTWFDTCNWFSIRLSQLAQNATNLQTISRDRLRFTNHVPWIVTFFC